MDTRSTASPTFKTPDLITAENFQNRINEVEALLHLEKQQLATIFNALTYIEYLESEIAKITVSSIDALNNLIIEYTTADVDDEVVAEFMSEKRAELTRQLQKAREKLITKKEEAIAIQKREIEKARATLLEKDINAGNHQIALDTFKFNVAVALQSAATRIHLTIKNIDPNRFNKLFRGLSLIKADGTLTHSNHTEDFLKGGLVALQQSINGILEDCIALGETSILNEIKLHLALLNHINNPLLKNQNIITIHDSHIRFADAVYRLERQCETACGLALTTYDEFIKNEDETLNGFRGATFNICDPIRTAITQADDDIEAMKTASQQKNEGRISELRAKRAATPEAAAAPQHRLALAPAPSPRPQAKADSEPASSFWQTPAFKRGLIGAAIALGVVATAALVTTIVFFSGGAGAIAIGAGIGALIAKFGIGGVVGLGIGIAATASIIGFFSGIRAGFQRHRPVVPSKEASLSSTTDLFREMPPSTSPVAKSTATAAISPAPAPTPSSLDVPAQEEEAGLRLSRK